MFYRTFRCKLSPEAFLLDFRCDLKDFQYDLKDFRYDLKDFRYDLKDFRCDLKDFRYDLKDLRCDLKDFRHDLKDFRCGTDMHRRGHYTRHVFHHSNPGGKNYCSSQPLPSHIRGAGVIITLF